MYVYFKHVSCTFCHIPSVSKMNTIPLQCPPFTRNIHYGQNKIQGKSGKGGLKTHVTKSTLLYTNLSVSMLAAKTLFISNPNLQKRMSKLSLNQISVEK